MRRRAQLVGVDFPPAVILKIVRLGAHTFEAGQVLEQRIAGSRHQHAVARVTEQLEQPAVRLARARRQHDVRRVDDHATPAMIVGDGGASRGESKGMRLVHEPPCLRERGQESVGIRDASPSRVRFGQIRDRRARGAQLRQGTRQLIRLCLGR